MSGIYIALCLAGVCILAAASFAIRAKKKRLKIIRCIAVVVAVALFSIIGFFTNVFLGNPVSFVLSALGTKQYMSERYPDKSFSIERNRYNFVISGYNVEVKLFNSDVSHINLSMDMHGNIVTVEAKK